MIPKQDKTYSRKASDIEQKYDLGAIGKGGSGDSVKVSQLEQTLSNYMTDTNIRINNINEELEALGNVNAEGVGYDNTSSSLTAENVQDAIDLLDENIGTITDDLVEYDSRITENKNSITNVYKATENSIEVLTQRVAGDEVEIADLGQIVVSHTIAINKANEDIQKNADAIEEIKNAGGGTSSDEVVEQVAELGERVTATENSLKNKVDTTDSRLSDARTPTAHTHDDRYYTETEVNNLLNAKQNSNTAITTSNIGSQSVKYATSSGSAGSVTGIVPIANGGTGANNTYNAVANLLGNGGEIANPTYIHTMNSNGYGKGSGHTTLAQLKKAILSWTLIGSKTGTGAISFSNYANYTEIRILVYFGDCCGFIDINASELNSSGYYYVLPGYWGVYEATVYVSNKSIQISSVKYHEQEKTSTSTISVYAR